MLTTVFAGKRSPIARLSIDGRSSHRVRTVRLFAILVGATALVGGWLIWRYWLNPAWVDQLPQSIVELLNVLSLSVAVTIGLLWAIIVYQRGRALSAKPAVANIAVLQALSPAEFEQFSAELFRSRGYRVEVRGRSGDLGVDLEIVKDSGKRAIAQCKRYRSTVGPDVVRELYGTMIHERVSHAFLVTTADISEGAREWAAGKPISLIDGATLLELANNAQVSVA